MLPTEYMVHEHRKEMLRTAAQVRLVRLVQVNPHPLNRWLTQVIAAFRRPPHQPTDD